MVPVFVIVFLKYLLACVTVATMRIDIYMNKLPCDCYCFFILTPARGFARVEFEFQKVA